MKKILIALVFTFIGSQSLALPINFNNVQEWALKNPLPENVIINSSEKKYSIVIHVNRYFKSNKNLIPDTIEFICGDKHYFYKAGTTSTCELPLLASASFGINTSAFHNGSEGNMIIQ